MTALEFVIVAGALFFVWITSRTTKHRKQLRQEASEVCNILRPCTDWKVNLMLIIHTIRSYFKAKNGNKLSWDLRPNEEIEAEGVRVSVWDVTVYPYTIAFYPLGFGTVDVRIDNSTLQKQGWHRIYCLYPGDHRWLVVVFMPALNMKRLRQRLPIVLHTGNLNKTYLRAVIPEFLTLYGF